MLFLASIFFGCTCYLILTVQLSDGFPPFYEKDEKKENMLLLLSTMFLAMLGFLGAAVLISFVEGFAPETPGVIGPILAIVVGLIPVWGGVQVRRSVRNRTSGPRLWLLTPLTVKVLNRWPMLLFDVWSLGVALLMGVLVFQHFAETAL